MKIAIAGGTGFVGRRLVERLQQEGQEAIVLSRNPEQARQVFPLAQYDKVTIVGYDPMASGDWQTAISGCDGVVNLAGEAIAEKRWTPEHKQVLLESRVVTTGKVVEAIQQAAAKPPVLVSASAIGYYGTSETAEFDETSSPGADFLAEICQQWEAAAQPVIACGTRLVILRLGIVLGLEGGALAKMLPVFRLFAGGPLGTGQQWMSWIHREDLVSLILTALTRSDWQGVYNATAPHPARMATFCDALGQQLNRPSWLPVPGFALEAMLGEGAKVVLEGQQVLPKRPIASGFAYQYPAVKDAIANLLQ
ncbi:MAG: TIGR01777 family oxidoreductase [Synechococcales bacterium]|nr:TIGR01777 family oxidoreductase [Synechococcales bacterium]